jgi:MoaA/NifB/PqqE/SkfB family radical SAM enzyme
MNIYPQLNGDIELADWPARKDPNWTNVMWIATQVCNINCAYCVGWKKTKASPTLLDVYGVAGTVARFEKIRSEARKEIYLTITGGEPLLVPALIELCAELTRRKFVIELQTNLLLPSFRNWVDRVDPAQVSQVMASYHAWLLDRDSNERERYLENFRYAFERGLTVVGKRIIFPGEARRAKEIMQTLERTLPAGAPALAWGYIKRVPHGLGDWNGAYPYSYTPAQKQCLTRLRKYRRECQRLFQEGGGFYRGMRCDSGRGFVFMGVDGTIARCYTTLLQTKKTIGDFGQGTIALHEKPEPCPCNYCGTTILGGRFGENPWDYVPGFTKEGCTFNRFGG